MTYATPELKVVGNATQLVLGAEPLIPVWDNPQVGRELGEPYTTPVLEDIE